MEREVRALELTEKKLIADIKAAAKKDATAARTLAVQLVRLREQKARLRGSTVHLQNASTSLTARSLCCASSLAEISVNSASFLAELSVSLPRKLFILLSKKIFSGSKNPKNI